jgi:serine/threonine-protein kinase
MSAPAPADGNLIFGLLALQMDFVTREQLLEALHAWMLDKQTPLGDILVRRGVLDRDDRDDLDRLVARHVRRHGDPRASLAALRVEPSVRHALESLPDAEVQRSVAALPPTPEAPDRSVGPPTADHVPDSPAGVRYRRLRVHAKGGLGEVFVALDEELHREVALKEILDERADEPDARARFLREAEVTGKLEHPGVVPVYGLGTYPDGRPFYAMRLIRGESMQAAIRRFHKADEEPRRDPGERSLALRELLSRFVAVCNAVAFAHSRGVLHRDIKPANCMLGEYGETLVVDWGLARLLDLPDTERPVLAGAGNGSAPTQMGHVVGTPSFMPPEQANGRLDQVGPHSDVFSLGATLYALLTGYAPYEGPDVLVQAAMGEVLPARRRKRSVPAALEAVCAKAMAAKPAERYPSAQALAQDVQRWLADEPVSAYREPWAGRAGRWLRRHKSLASTTAAALLVTLVLGGFGAWRLEQQAARQRRAVESALEEVARLQGQARWTEARIALDAAESRLGDAGAGSLRVRLEQARRDLDLVARLDAIRLKRATWLGDRFDTAGADRGYEEAFRDAGMAEVGGDIEVAAAWLGDSAVRDALVAALDDWAACAGKHERRNWLLAVARRADPDPWRDRVRDPAVWDDGTGLARLVRGKAAADQSPQLLAALALRVPREEAERLLRRAQERHPEDFWLNFSLGDALAEGKKPGEAVGFYRAALALRPGTYAVYNNLGVALDAKGKVDEAIACYRKAIALDPKLAGAHTNLGVALCDKGKVDAAIGEYRKAIDLDPRLAPAHYNLGKALDAKGKVEEAIACYRKAVALDPKNALAHTNLGVALAGKGKVDEAIACFRRAIDLDPRLAPAYSNLGVALKAKGKLEEAIECYRKAIDSDPRLAPAHYNLGLALYGQGKVDEAISHYRKAIAIDPGDAKAHTNLGVALRDKGKVDEAISHDRRAIALDPKLPLAHINLGVALYGKGKVDEAIACYRKAIAIDPKLAQAHTNLGASLYGKGKVDEAIACFQKAVEIDPKLAEAHCNLGDALRSQGRLAESLGSYRRGHALGSKRPGWSYPSLRWVRQARRLVRLEKELPDLLSGKRTPASPAERVEYAAVCALTRRYRGAARLYAKAFTADPTLADDLQAAHRYAAARAAALAAAGQGRDPPGPDDKERARLRRRALGWLRADLALWGKEAMKGTPEARAEVQKTLRHWQKDPDLAGVRQAAALEELPEAERAEWQKLWGEVEALLKK